MKPASLRSVLIPLVGGLTALPAAAQWTAYRLHTGGVGYSEVHAVSPLNAFGHVAAGSQVLPVVWSGTAWTSYLPSGYQSGKIWAASGGQLVGQFNSLAGMWQGGPQSTALLHPPGFDRSSALATDGQTQTGYVIPSIGIGLRHAVLWRGSAASMVNLHPSGAYESVATAVAGDLAGGWVSQATVPSHATIWSGSAASMVDLHPPGVPGSSMVLGMVEGQQVGYVNGLAAMWSGTAASFVSLAPPWAHGSRLYATTGSAQVGYVGGAGFQEFHAGIWFGSAQSFVRLSDFLPPGQYGSSFATSVAERNGVYYVGGYAWVGNHSEAILWVGVPAPGTATTMIAIGLWTTRRSRGPARHTAR